MPTFAANGRLLVGAQPYEALEQQKTQLARSLERLTGELQKAER